MSAKASAEPPQYFTDEPESWILFSSSYFIGFIILIETEFCSIGPFTSFFLDVFENGNEGLVVFWGLAFLCGVLWGFCSCQIFSCCQGNIYANILEKACTPQSPDDFSIFHFCMNDWFWLTHNFLFFFSFSTHLYSPVFNQLLIMSETHLCFFVQYWNDLNRKCSSYFEPCATFRPFVIRTISHTVPILKLKRSFALQYKTEICFCLKTQSLGYEFSSGSDQDCFSFCVIFSEWERWHCCLYWCHGCRRRCTRHGRQWLSKYLRRRLISMLTVLFYYYLHEMTFFFILSKITAQIETSALLCFIFN